jgi:hypothetical protein
MKRRSAWTNFGLQSEKQLVLDMPGQGKEEQEAKTCTENESES